jgi:hypothetical protein
MSVPLDGFPVVLGLPTRRETTAREDAGKMQTRHEANTSLIVPAAVIVRNISPSNIAPRIRSTKFDGDDFGSNYAIS